MKLHFSLVVVVGLLVGCTKSDAAGPAAPASAATVVADSKAVISLGRELCQGCVDGATTKLAGVAGIGTLALNPGAKDLTVHYDGKKITPAGIVAKLVAAGEADAKLVQ